MSNGRASTAQPSKVNLEIEVTGNLGVLGEKKLALVSKFEKFDLTLDKGHNQNQH